MDWRKVYQTSAVCTRNSKLIDLNFTFLQRQLATNSYFQRIGIRQDGRMHLLPEWKRRSDALTLVMRKTNVLVEACDMASVSSDSPSSRQATTMETALGLKPDSSNFKLQINFYCLMAKHCIYICLSKEL